MTRLYSYGTFQAELLIDHRCLRSIAKLTGVYIVSGTSYEGPIFVWGAYTLTNHGTINFIRIPYQKVHEGPVLLWG